MTNPFTEAFHEIERLHLSIYGWEGDGAHSYMVTWQGPRTRCVCGRDVREEIRSAEFGQGHRTLIEAIVACLDLVRAAHPELFEEGGGPKQES